MIKTAKKFFGRKSKAHTGPLVPTDWSPNAIHGGHSNAPKPTYSKTFHWLPPEEYVGHPPHSVEIVGSFSNWRRVAMVHDRASRAWHVTINEIQAHKMHHYMMLVDGKPVHDSGADGLSVPHCDQEREYQIETPRGPRVFMMCAQTK